MSSDVFSSSAEIDDSYFTYSKITKKKKKRILASENSTHPKKIKFFVRNNNRYSSIAINGEITCITSIHTQINTETPEANDEIKSPTPIFIREVLNFFSFTQHFISLVGSDNFLFKSSTNVLQI